MEGPPLKRTRCEEGDDDNSTVAAPVTQCVVLMVVSTAPEDNKLYIIEEHKCPQPAWACLCNRPLSGRSISNPKDWEGSDGEKSCVRFLRDEVLRDGDMATSSLAPRCSAFFQLEEGELPLQIVAAHSVYDHDRDPQ